MEQPSHIRDLPYLVSNLPTEGRACFERIFHVIAADAEAVPPGRMQPWIVKYFGSVDAIRMQRIVKITNKVSLEGALFNALRALRPIQVPLTTEKLGEGVDNREDCAFCHPLECTPADAFGRIRGRHCITASNVAKCDGWHSVIIFDEHDPLRFTADQVADYLDTAQEWAQKAHQADPDARYPFFLWNCLWRSGASIFHGHAQMSLTRGMHYAKVEVWRQAALRYRENHGKDYFVDLVAAHRDLGLAENHGTATILPSLTPFKEKETHIIAPRLDDDMKTALYRVLSTFVRRLGVEAFNLVLYQPPLSNTPEDWTGFPFIFRILDRGNLQSQISDVGAMEFFGQSVVATDPFSIIHALHTESGEKAL
jgi:galactose-1-phosphate uridylyltransferase